LLGRRLRYVTVVSNGETGDVLGIVNTGTPCPVYVPRVPEGQRWRGGGEVVVSDAPELSGKT